ncbi:hypothetical protein H8D36_03215 [archaeon]|nr:hypothetical protein [archaeon]MBL7057159.1 hypothetical protein [Candidatus Woesearchaeota archaeon]
MGILQTWSENRTLNNLLENEDTGLVSEVSEEVVRNRISKAIKKKDYKTLRALHEYYPSVEPDREAVQKSYSKLYDKNDLPSAHDLFSVFGIEPAHPLSEEETIIEIKHLKGEVISRLKKDPVIFKDKHYLALQIEGIEKPVMTAVSGRDYYHSEKGTKCSVKVPFVQKVNMLGHPIGETYAQVVYID